MGNFELDPIGAPILSNDRNYNLIDRDGKRVNSKGYLIDNRGNVINRNGDLVSEIDLGENLSGVDDDSEDHQRSFQNTNANNLYERQSRDKYTKISFLLKNNSGRGTIDQEKDGNGLNLIVDTLEEDFVMDDDEAGYDRR